MTQPRHELDEQALRAALDEAADRAGPLAVMDRRAIEADAGRRRTRRTALVACAASVAVAAVVTTSVVLLGNDTEPTRAIPATAPTATPSVSLAPAPKNEPTAPPRLPAPVDSGPTASPALTAVSDAAHAVGTETRADIFTNMKVNECYCSVTVYLTDLGQQGAYLAAMQAVRPELDPALVHFAQGTRTGTACQDLLRTTFQILSARTLPFEVYGAGATIDCSAINVDVSAVEAAQAYFDDPANGIQSHGIAVKAVPGSPVMPLTGTAE